MAAQWDEEHYRREQQDTRGMKVDMEKMGQSLNYRGKMQVPTKRKRGREINKNMGIVLKPMRNSISWCFCKATYNLYNYLSTYVYNSNDIIPLWVINLSPSATNDPPVPPVSRMRNLLLSCWSVESKKCLTLKVIGVSCNLLCNWKEVPIVKDTMHLDHRIRRNWAESYLKPSFLRNIFHYTITCDASCQRRKVFSSSTQLWYPSTTPMAYLAPTGVIVPSLVSNQHLFS